VGAATKMFAPGGTHPRAATEAVFAIAYPKN